MLYGRLDPSSEWRYTVWWYCLIWCCGCLALLAAGCGVGERHAQTEPPRNTPKTAQTAATTDSIPEQLKKIALDDERAKRVKDLQLPQGIGEAASPLAQAALRCSRATTLLNDGHTAEALQGLAEAEQFLKRVDPRMAAVMMPHLLRLQALGYLRLGEQQNCSASHNAQSCLMPIHGTGVHTIQTGSRRAIECLTRLLKIAPQDLRARWLLNVAYMTLGEYPAQVPAQWRIPPSAFKSDYDIKRFPNVAGAVGLDVNALSGGTIVEDFDGDGSLDVMCSSRGLRDQLRYFHNNSDGTFTERTKQAGLTGEIGGLNTVAADYNNDGYPDVLVLRGAWGGPQGHHPNSLLRNNGDGTFTNVTAAAGVLSYHPTQTATWFDYDNDGWLDLFIGNETHDNDTNPCELYYNNGDGTFTECAATVGLAVEGYVKGVTSGDYNNDGRCDLYLSLQGQPNRLFRNDGPDPAQPSNHKAWKFADVTKVAGVEKPIWSFPCFFFDYDNDGWLDLFVCAGNFITGKSDGVNVAEVAADYVKRPNHAERSKLYHNNHDGTFTDVTAAAHLNGTMLGMGLGFGDLDNDGFLDFYVGTGDPDLNTLIPNLMFRNNAGRSFQNVTFSGDFGHLQKGHGVTFADIDNDGDQDIYESMGGAFPGDTAFNTLYENPGHGHHFVTLKLVGAKSNREAIGARVHVVVDSPTGPRSIYRTVTTGASFGSLPSRLEIGLGPAQAIDSVSIFWPVTGLTQVIRNLKLDSYYRIREDSAAAEPLPVKHFHLSHATPAMSHMMPMPGM